MKDTPLGALVLHQDPVQLPPEAEVRTACCRMRDSGVGAMLVTDPDGHLLGIFTGRDAVGRILAAGLSLSGLRLADVMTPNPVTLLPDAMGIEALRLMRDGGFRHVPVVDTDNRLLGVVSWGDFRAAQHDRLDEEVRMFEMLR